MKTYLFEGKTKEQAIENAINTLNTTRENLIIKSIEEKQNLLKKNTKIEVININELQSYIKETIEEILNMMKLESKIELIRTNENISINIDTNNNSILIGKNGRTINSIQNIIKQIIEPQINNKYKILVDIGDYKEKRKQQLERNAKKIAKEVYKTKIETKLESMNSYERRIIHNVLSDNKYVYTESIGEEPNRCVVIKPKD